MHVIHHFNPLLGIFLVQCLALLPLGLALEI